MENNVFEQSWDIPAYEVRKFNTKRNKYALVIPVINEGERIRAQLDRCQKAELPVDVVVADGGSTDGSLDADFLEAVGISVLLTKTGAGKLSAQLRMAYAWCLSEGYDGIITVDGNGKDGISAVFDMCAKLDEGYDYVQGSRYLDGGSAENTPLERAFGNRLIHAPILSLAGKHRFTDTTNGFRAYSKKYLTDERVAPFRDIFKSYELLFYLTVRAGQLGFKVCEIPVIRSYPKDGTVPTKISNLKGKLDILKQTFSAATGAFNP